MLLSACRGRFSSTGLGRGLILGLCLLLSSLSCVWLLLFLVATLRAFVVLPVSLAAALRGSVLLVVVLVPLALLLLSWLLSLNWGCNLLLVRLNNVACKLGPQVFELGDILLDVEGMVDNEQVFLVGRSGLESPVERACEEE